MVIQRGLSRSVRGLIKWKGVLSYSWGDLSKVSQVLKRKSPEHKFDILLTFFFFYLPLFSPALLTGLSSVPYFTTTTTTTTASVTTAAPTTTRPPPTTPYITRRPPGTTRRPFNGRRPTTTSAPVTTPLPTTTTTAAAAVTTTALPPATTTARVRGKLHHKAQKPCSSHPCLHGGTCEDDGNDFSCMCPAGWGGTVCEKGKLVIFSRIPHYSWIQSFKVWAYFKLIWETELEQTLPIIWYYCR